MTKIFTTVLLALVLVYASAVSSIAVTTTIGPQELIPRTSDTTFKRDPINITGTHGISQFYKVVTLPVGSTITKLTYYHNGVGTSPFTSVQLMRIKMGGTYEELVNVTSEKDTAGGVIPVTVAVKANNKVSKGYTYFVFAICRGATSGIHGIKINYR